MSMIAITFLTIGIVIGFIAADILKELTKSIIYGFKRI